MEVRGKGRSRGGGERSVNNKNTHIYFEGFIGLLQRNLK